MDFVTIARDAAQRSWENSLAHRLFRNYIKEHYRKVVFVIIYYKIAIIWNRYNPFT